MPEWYEFIRETRKLKQKYFIIAEIFKLVTEVVNDVLDTQREMEEKFSKLMVNENEKNPQAIGDATKSLKASTYGLHRTQKQNPLAVDNMEKIESDR